MSRPIQQSEVLGSAEEQHHSVSPQHCEGWPQRPRDVCPLVVAKWEGSVGTGRLRGQMCAYSPKESKTETEGRGPAVIHKTRQWPHRVYSGKQRRKEKNKAATLLWVQFSVLYMERTRGGEGLSAGILWKGLVVSLSVSLRTQKKCWLWRSSKESL